MRTLKITTVVISLFFLSISCSSEVKPQSEDQEVGKTETEQVNTEEATSSSSSIDTESYMELDSDMPLDDYSGQKIWFSGTIAKEVNQHIMKDAPPFGEPEKNICIDYNDGEQTIGYYTNLTIPEDEVIHKFYGTADKITGTDESGEMITEYYINLDNID